MMKLQSADLYSNVIRAWQRRAENLRCRRDCRCSEIRIDCDSVGITMSRGAARRVASFCVSRKADSSFRV